MDFKYDALCPRAGVPLDQHGFQARPDMDLTSPHSPLPTHHLPRHASLKAQVPLGLWV